MKNILSIIFLVVVFVVFLLVAKYDRSFYDTQPVVEPPVPVGVTPSPPGFNPRTPWKE